MGSGGRTNAFAYDPLLPEEIQANIADGGYMSSNGNTRTLLVACANRRRNESANSQVYYATNIFPLNFSLSGGIYTDIQNRIRDIASSSEITYVVVGLITSGSTSSVLDRSGNQVTVPTHVYHIALIKYPNVNLGWGVFCSLLDCETEELQYPTIAELEEITGECFYPNLEAQVGEETYLEIKQMVTPAKNRISS